MRARREATLSLLCALLVACSASASAPDSSRDPTIDGVGILPDSRPDSEVIVETVPSTLATTTLPPEQTIGALVTGNKLLMIGDSITASAAKRYGGELCDALVPLGWQVEVDAEPSRFVDFGNQVLGSRLAAGWDAAYVFLGTNYLGDQQSYRNQLEKMVQLLAPRPVVLLTVTEFEDNRREVNDVITLVSAEFTNVRLLDWGAMAAAGAATMLRGDGHHLTNDGRAALASTVAGVMGAAPAQPGKCLSTSFSNDSGGSVNGSDAPPKKKVGPPTQTTAVKQQTSTTAIPGAPPTIPSATTVVATIPPTTLTTIPPTTLTTIPPTTLTTVPPTPTAASPTTKPVTTTTAIAGAP
jgi:hypothetical protein